MSTSYHALFQDRTNFREWRAMALVAGAAFICGFVGFWQYEAQHAGEHMGFFEHMVTAFYHTLQMMILHTPHLELPVKPVLHAGRILAGVVFFWAAIKVILLAAQRDWNNITVWWQKGHVVICGLGELGLSLALQAKERGQRPVVIEQDADSREVLTAIRNGVPVVIGDATNINTLRRARAYRAEKIFAVCTNDQTNIDIASTAGRLQPSSNLSCWLFINDSHLRSAMQNHQLPVKQSEFYSVNVRGLDMEQVTARRVFSSLPLDHIDLPENSVGRPALLIVGFGKMGQELALQAARVAHFPSGGLLQVTVIDEQAERRVKELKGKYPNLDKVMDIQAIETSPEFFDTLQRLVDVYIEADQSQQLLGCAVCFDGEDMRNTSLALKWREEFHEGSAPVLVYLRQSPALVKVLTGQEFTASRPPLIPFGMMEEIWNLETLQDEVQDQLARAHHEFYCNNIAKNRSENPQIPIKPSEKPWANLDETYKASNRAAADHIRYKLHIVDLEIRPLSQMANQPPLRISEEQLEMLSKIEHARWCAERWLDNWTFTEVIDRNRKMHDQLLSWDKLEEGIRNIDRDLMKNILQILERAGLEAAPRKKREEERNAHRFN